MKKIFANIFNLYLILLGTLVILPILAPILLHLGLEGPAKIIYFVYSFFCHQFASRSINIYDYQIAWCARDTAIWSGMFLTALLVRFDKLPILKWYWVIPFIIPMALDGGLQTVFTFLNLTPQGVLTGEAIYVSNNLSRFITGAIFGVGVGWWLAQQFKMQIYEIKVEVKKNVSKFEHIIKAALLVIGLILFYVLLVQIWNLTSIKNKPLDFLDSTSKSTNDLFFARRENAICPTRSTTDLFNFECFFGN